MFRRRFIVIPKCVLLGIPTKGEFDHPGIWSFVTRKNDSPFIEVI